MFLRGGTRLALWQGPKAPGRCVNLGVALTGVWGVALEEASCERIRSAREAGGRVVAVGTTSVRSLETAAAGGEIRP